MRPEGIRGIGKGYRIIGNGGIEGHHIRHQRELTRKNYDRNIQQVCLKLRLIKNFRHCNLIYVLLPPEGVVEIGWRTSY